MSVRALLPRPCLPPLWRELSAVRELAAAGGASRPALGRASGVPVLLIPGFLAGDVSLRWLELHLEACGHRPWRAGMRANVGCSEAAIDRLVARLRLAADHHGRRVAVVGHSRGGLFARVVARRHPDLVSCAITLGSPHRDQLAVHPLVWAQALAIASLGALGLPGVLGFGCAADGCCERFLADLAAPLPAGVGYLSIYSRRDGVVDWRACLEPDGRHLEVPVTHCGLALDSRALRAVDTALARLGEPPPAPDAALTSPCPRPGRARAARPSVVRRGHPRAAAGAARGQRQLSALRGQ